MVFLPNGSAEGRRILVDTCVLGQAFNYNGMSLLKIVHCLRPQSLLAFSDAFKQKAIAHTLAMQKFIDTHQTIILDEVLSEFSFFKNGLDEKYRVFSLKSPELDEIRHSSFYRGLLYNFGEVNSAVQSLGDSLNAHRKPIDWNAVFYRSLLEEARWVFVQNPGRYRRSLEHSTHCRLGRLMETDLKLVAYSFLSSYRHPTTCITCDTGLTNLIESVNDELCKPECWRSGRSEHKRNRSSDLRTYNCSDGNEKEIPFIDFG